MKYRTAIDETTTIINKLKSLTKFSRLIQFHYPNLIAEELNRDVIGDYLVYLKEKQNSTGTRIQDIGCLSQFLENCARFSWAKSPRKQLIYKEDYPKKENLLPRFIPNNVLKQIEDNLDALPQPVVDIVKVIRETGIRISELCGLNLNCIRQDKTGTWWIDIYQNKMKKEIPPLPITKELATAIQEQQQYIKDNLGAGFSYLFCEPKYRSSFSLVKSESNSRYIQPKELNYFEPIPQKLQPETVRGYFHRLANERDIRDSSGELFLGKCHQFRHTHGTELINAGVQKHIVQKRLGHKSADMTSTYAHIHNETMKREMEKFWDGKLVNIKGEEIESLNPDLDTPEMQWFKKNMKAQALPTGWCRLSTKT